MSEEKKSSKMLDVLRRETEDQKQQLLSDTCDLCHYPFDLTQNALEEKCAECTICQDLEALLKKQRTVTIGEVMGIVAEEMHVVQASEGGARNASPSLV